VIKQLVRLNFIIVVIIIIAAVQTERLTAKLKLCNFYIHSL